MRPKGVSVAVLLLVSASLAVQASPAEDLYWEGEDDASKEFLEVKNEDIGIGGHLMRIKRDLFDIFSAFSPTTSTTTPEPPLEEISTDDPDADVQDRDEDLERGSGSHDPVDQDLKEKTLRVTFVVMEPYQSEYSNRDSYQFLSFSKAIADAVNLLYENLPGTQKASLVRIQSRISDEFSCKVTLDIVTTGYDDTDRIAQILQDHIRNRRELGSVAVSDQDFKTNVIDPGYTEPQCSVDEIQCSDDTCVSGSARCDGYLDCPDGSDEQGCPSFDRSPTTTVAPVPESTTRGPISCPPGEFSCDETRCVSYDKRCDNRPDCYDGTDEQNCRPGTPVRDTSHPTNKTYTKEECSNINMNVRNKSTNNCNVPESSSELLAEIRQLRAEMAEFKQQCSEVRHLRIEIQELTKQLDKVPGPLLLKVSDSETQLKNKDKEILLLNCTTEELKSQTATQEEVRVKKEP